MSLTEDWQSIVARLATRPTALDRSKVEAALRCHFERLDLPCPPIRWVNDAQVGYTAARSAARSAAESAVRSAAWSAAESAAESAAWSASWSAAESAADSAASDAQNAMLEEMLLELGEGR